MALLRDGHGTGAGRPHIEVPPADELAPGLLAPAPAPDRAQPWSAPRAFGPLPKGSAEASALARHARQRQLEQERERAQQARCLLALGLRSLPDDPLLEAYLDDGNAFAELEVQRLALEVGGGYCPPSAASMVQSSALALAYSRYLYAKGDPAQIALASKLAVESRQGLLAAHTIAALTAKARADQPGENDIDRLRRRMAQGGDGTAL